MLQYVAFPRVELKQQGDALPASEWSQGRRDMTFFFDWLRRKGVQRIIKVIVDDIGLPPHSDEAIEEALQPFGPEILDWRRLDLDPVTLQRVGKNLREVHLQWSGRNTVLRSWSEAEGLAKTPTLESIHILQTEVRPRSHPRLRTYLQTLTRAKRHKRQLGPKLQRTNKEKSL